MTMNDWNMTASTSRGGETMRVMTKAMMSGMVVVIMALTMGVQPVIGQSMARAGAAVGQGSARGGYDSTPREAWLQEDPGGRLYQEAREALNRRRYERAADLFSELRDEHPRSGYVADSFYWEAFSLFREGGNRNLREAAELLSIQANDHPDAGTRRDADALMVRIEAQLARRGDADAAAAIAEQASGPCDEDQEVRLAALSALMNMNAEQAVPILQEVLQSRGECSVELRRRAVFLISQKMTDESVDILLDLAHRNPDPDPEVREQAIFWLHQVDTPEALAALESILLESDSPEMQERAIFAISQRSNDRRAIEVLKSYAERDDIPSELRANAIFWISQNPDAGGAMYLMDLYPRLDDPELRERAIFGISQAGGPEARSWLLGRVRDRDESVEVRKNALFWVGQMGGLRAEDFDGLYDTLADSEMKEQVIFVASQSGEPQAVDFLMDVARNEEEKELKERAIFWLGQSNDPRVPDFLLSLIRGGVVNR
jgi:HEAT repeat protein